MKNGLLGDSLFVSSIILSSIFRDMLVLLGPIWYEQTNESCFKFASSLWDRIEKEFA